MKKLIISDYNRLPYDISTTWINKYFGDNYLIYDRYHRFEESDKIKHQVDVGVNIYDIFDFVETNYDDLPDICVFCKDDVIPRHCSIEKFESIINNIDFTPIENYIRNTPLYSPDIYSYVTENDEYYENSFEVNYTVSNIYPGKYFHSYQDLLKHIFKNPVFGEYIRFAPGGNYLIPKHNLLKYNRFFYSKMREYVSWTERPGEAYLFERALYSIFNSDYVINDIYKY